MEFIAGAVEVPRPILDVTSRHTLRDLDLSVLNQTFLI
jgi:hypothetical protein